METVIAVKYLRKSYRPQGDRKNKKPEIKAVDGITFEVGRGELRDLGR